MTSLISPRPHNDCNPPEPSLNRPPSLPPSLCRRPSLTSPPTSASTWPSPSSSQSSVSYLSFHTAFLIQTEGHVFSFAGLWAASDAAKFLNLQQDRALTLHLTLPYQYVLK
ncbi:hypothetical protein TIFTF001_031774 [Ficus carica]|uniref:Uncharacterized protein n=1 Tax=Ficus carica TaxID=3494 RepID=A0AA88DW48_FICCA|nr:hypothetical protein TIFTF001_031774 [Ficus carica]